jgi:hypothetical protein
MTLAESDAAMGIVCDLERQAYDLTKTAERYAALVQQQYGIECHNREPGFPCWTHVQLGRYCNTPREVVKELQALQRAENTR